MTPAQFSIFIVLFGFGIYFMRWKAKIERAKGHRIHPRWLWNNRRAEVISSLMSSLGLGTAFYVYMAPDLLLAAGDHKQLGLYVVGQLLIGAFGTYIIDMAFNVGAHKVGARSVPVTELDDDGKTRFTPPESQ